MMKDYEELDPDNQDQPYTYYKGVGDGMRYAMNILTDAFPDNNDPANPRIEAVIEALHDVYECAEDHRDIYFRHHMGAKYDVRGKLKLAYGSGRPVAEQGAH